MKLTWPVTIALLAVLFLSGCGGPSIEGDWAVVPAEEMPFQATVTMNFEKPDKARSRVLAQTEAPLIGEVKIQADIVGTWNLENDVLTFVPQDAKLSSTDGKDIPGFIADQAKSMIQDKMAKTATGKVKWSGSDKFTVVLDGGQSAVFTQLKS